MKPMPMTEGEEIQYLDFYHAGNWTYRKVSTTSGTITYTRVRIGEYRAERQMVISEKTFRRNRTR